MTIRTERHGPTAVITIDRPEKMNALTRDMYRQIAWSLREVDEEKAIRVAVVTGAGAKAFSAGADLGDAHESAVSVSAPWSPPRPESFGNGLQMSKPVIAAIEGYCLAGGFELAMFCDVRICSSTGCFGIPEVRWNLIAGYGAAKLGRLIGLSNALYLLLSGRMIDAERALAIGLVQEVVPPGEALSSAMKLADEIAAHGPMAVRMTKELARRGFESEADAVVMASAFYALIDRAEDTAEGTRSFAEKRPAEYRDR